MVALREGVLVVQEGPDLAATSILESKPGSGTSRDLEQVRNIVRGHGQVDARQCEKWEFSFDESATAALTRLPGWERHLATLLFNIDEATRAGAVAAAVRLKSRQVARALVAVLSAEDSPLNHRTDPRSPNPRYRFAMRLAEEAAYLRSLAVMALVSMSYEEAAMTLAKHAQRSPLPGYDPVVGCSSDIAAICDFLNHSHASQAHQAIANYDTWVGADGAFKALCRNQRD
jgi:hypothetical protein